MDLFVIGAESAKYFSPEHRSGLKYLSVQRFWRKNGCEASPFLCQNLITNIIIQKIAIKFHFL